MPHTDLLAKAVLRTQ